MLGVHLPLENPLQLTAYNAKELGLDTFQMFIRNNRNMKRRFISESEFNQFNYYGFKHIVIHAPYAMNPSADDVDARRRYLDFVNSDLLLCSKFNAKVSYVLHPGSCQSGRTIAMTNLIDFVRNLKDVPNVTVCLEYMSGAGSQMLSCYEECLSIAEKCKDKIRLCLDTCHMFTSVSDWQMATAMLLPYTDVVHVNNSMYPKGSRKDRHANLSDGCIPTDDLIKYVKGIHYLKPDIPFILETPREGIISDYNMLKEEILRV